MSRDIDFTEAPSDFFKTQRVHNAFTRSGLHLVSTVPAHIVDESFAPPRLINLVQISIQDFDSLLQVFMDWDTMIPAWYSHAAIKSQLQPRADDYLKTELTPNWSVQVNYSIPVGDRWKVGADLHVQALLGGKVPYTTRGGRYELARIAVDR